MVGVRIVLLGRAIADDCGAAIAVIDLGEEARRKRGDPGGTQAVNVEGIAAERDKGGLALTKEIKKSRAGARACVVRKTTDLFERELELTSSRNNRLRRRKARAGAEPHR